MIEQIREWAFAVCAAAAIGGLINIIMPEGGLSKTLKSVISVFFLCTVISAFTKIDFDIADFKINENKIYESKEFEEINSVSEEYLEGELYKSVTEILEAEEIYAKDILIKINISENGSIDINKFAIAFEQLEDPFKLEEKIYNKTGIKPNIILSGES